MSATFGFSIIIHSVLITGKRRQHLIKLVNRSIVTLLIFVVGLNIEGSIQEESFRVLLVQLLESSAGF